MATTGMPRLATGAHAARSPRTVASVTVLPGVAATLLRMNENVVRIAS